MVESILSWLKNFQIYQSKEVIIENKVGTDNGYSEYAYDISSATQDNVIYPSLDPMIFEVKYPNTDILGKVVTM